MLSLVPPVGSDICLRDAVDGADPWRHEMRLYGSGTAALAAALGWISEVRPGRRDVLLPAYGCPALVSAVLHAGLRPVLIDLAPDMPFPSAEDFSRAMTRQTAACVHVNFLGLPPPEPITDPSEESAGLHVYDSCQAWPDGGRCVSWADVTVVSFGRGKPVTLGGGGGMIPNERHLGSVPCSPPAVANRAFAFKFRAAMYGLALRPRIFWWIDRLPWLNVGGTRYRALSEIDGMNIHATRLLQSNVANYLRSQGWTLAKVRGFLDARRLERFKLPSGASGAVENSRLLRLPLLAESRVVRDRAVKQLRKAGFSGTAMYGSPLWTFAGLESLREFERACPNATSFADRLLTVPTHNGVDDVAMETILQVLGSL